MTKALVLFSGGQDSSLSLAWALHHFDEVYTLGFFYGQRHRVELDCRSVIRQALKERFGFSDKLKADRLVDVSFVSSLTPSAMTKKEDIQRDEKEMPSTFVPGRNQLFFTIAASYAYTEGIEHIVAGMSQTDYSGYPDCRDDFVMALQKATSLALDRPFTFHTPLMFLSKKDEWTLARELGGDALVDLIRIESHTCYLGERKVLHPWGYGCGTCPACLLRKEGWEAFEKERL